MPRISLKNAAAGMQLSRPVLNGAGAMLVDGGAGITQEMIEKLADANVRYLFVVGQPDDAPVQEMLSALEERFIRTKNEPHMDGLKLLLQEHLQEIYS